MLNTSDLPNDARECSLRQVLDLKAPSKYFLSGKAIAYLHTREPKRLPLHLQLKADGDITIARSSLQRKEALAGLRLMNVSD